MNSSIVIEVIYYFIISAFLIIKWALARLNEPKGKISVIIRMVGIIVFIFIQILVLNNSNYQEESGGWISIIYLMFIWLICKILEFIFVR